MGIITPFFRMNLKYLLIAISLTLSSVNALAQIDLLKDKEVKIIDGKKYFAHTVAKGETLYGIAKNYGVEVKDIVLENPLTINGLKVGETIKVPVPIIVIDPMVLDGKYIYHTVQPGETFYSLSRKYEISIETIDLANPEIIGSIKAGSSVRIPVLRKSISKSSLLEEVLESLDTNLTVINDSSNADSALVIIKDTILLKDTYQISLMLPLYLNENDTLAGLRKADDPVKVYQKSIIGIEFYQGASLALDSLRMQGYKAKVTVYDTQRDTSKMKEFMEDTNLVYSDLLIGPLYRSNLAVIRQYAIDNRIHMVSPFISTNKILIGNEFMSKVKPAVQTHVEEIARYISSEFLVDNDLKFESSNLILVHNGDAGEQMLCELYKQKDEQLRVSTNDSMSSVAIHREIKVVNYLEREMEAIEEALSLMDSNILVILSRDQVFVSKIISKLHRKHDDYSMVVFGLPVWRYFRNLESTKLMDLNVHIASGLYIDYKSEAVIQFINSFTKKFNQYPSQYAFEGFDVTYSYLQVLQKYGSNFSSYLPEAKVSSLKSFNHYSKIGIGSGYENKRVFILKYEDYDLVLKSGDE